MKVFKIPVFWQMSGEYQIEAETLEEAIEKTQPLQLPEGDYLTDSCQPDYVGIMESNPDLTDEEIAYCEENMDIG